jgi:hypothetical protein
MADRQVNIRVRIEGAQGIEKLTQATRGAGAAAQEAEQRYQKMNAATAKAFDPRAEAQKVLVRRAQQTAVQREVERLSPTPATPAAPWGVPGSLASLAGLSAISSGARALGTGGVAAQQAAVGGQFNAGQTFGKVFAEMAEGVPIIGSFVSGLRDLFSVLSGNARKISELKRDVEGRSQAEGLARARSAATFAGSQRIAALQSGALDAATSTNAAAGFAAGLTPDVLAGFRSDSFGGQRRDIALAEAQATAARGAVGNRQAAANVAAVKAASASERLNEADAKVGDINSRIAEAQRRGDSKAALALQGQRVIAGQEALTAGQNAGQANTSLQERLTELQKAQADAAQKELAAKQATVNLEKARVGVLQQGAVAAGLSQPGELQSILAAVKQAQQFGFGNLVPEAQQALLANPTTADFARRQAQELGQQNPVQRELEQVVGLRGAGDNRTADEMADALERASAAIAEEGARNIQEAFETGMTGLVKAIQDGVAIAIQNATNQARQQAADKKLQEDIQGQQR